MNVSTLRALADSIHLLLDKKTNARKDVAWGILLEALTSTAVLLGPIALKFAVDEMSRPHFNVLAAVTYVALFALLWSASAVTAVAVLAYTNRIVDRAFNLLLSRALVNQLPLLARGTTMESGQIHGLLERLPYSLQVIIEGVLWKIAPVMIQLATALVLISLLVPARYCAVLFAVLAGYFVFSHLSAKQYEKSAESINQAAGVLSSALGDVLRNAPRVVYNGALNREIEYVHARANARLNVDWHRSWLLTRASIYQYGIIGAGMIALFVMCVSDLHSGQITLGDFILLQTYTLQFALPLGSYGFVLHQAGAAFANLREALDIAPTVRQLPGTDSDTPVALRTNLVVTQVSLNRPNRFALGPISFNILAGSHTAIVGHNGSGKSTLAKVIAGLLPPDNGTVCLDGTDLYRMDTRERSRFVLYVPQDVSLLSRTLRENVCYFPSQLTDADAIGLLERLSLYDDGRSIDLNAEVGEGGAFLSGGQVQKIELARLMGVTVPVIVLDETTSGLDPQSDALAVAMLRERLHRGTTLLMITHRIANVMMADQVLFLSGGTLAGIGPHRQLMEQSAEYRSFWNSVQVEASSKRRPPPESLGAGLRRLG